MKIKVSILFPIAAFGVALIALILFFMNALSASKPQDPSRPYPYHSETVTFQNEKADVTLAGTLTLPSNEGTFPVVLISGSGPQNRDEELAGHRPFLVIADHLTKNGIAVLRYDDRGFGNSTGDFSAATTVDFASDVEGAIVYLKTRKEISRDRIGLIGHSEGAVIAPMVATASEDVSFVVLLAGQGIELRKLLMLQQELILRASGVPDNDIRKLTEINEKVFEMISKSQDRQTLQTDLTRLIKENSDIIPEQLKPANMSDGLIAKQVAMLSSPWYQQLLNYDPVPTLEKVTCPVLALNGEKDLQVPPKENLTGIRLALEKGGNTDVTIRELRNLHHLFQECETGLPAEYAKIEQTFSPVALEELSNWILKQVM